MSDEASKPPGGAPPAKDYTRQLGVVESLVAITNECQSGPVRTVASQALDAIKNRGSGVMREQVYYVLSSMQGWRGKRATQVHRSLSAYYQSSEPESSEPETTDTRGDTPK